MPAQKVSSKGKTIFVFSTDKNRISNKGAMLETTGSWNKIYFFSMLPYVPLTMLYWLIS